MLTAHEFLQFLGRGIPVQLHGVNQRLQCDWSPRELTKTMKNDMIECIDCNSPNEEIHMLTASDFFNKLSTNITGKVYKVKVCIRHSLDSASDYF